MKYGPLATTFAVLSLGFGTAWAGTPQTTSATLTLDYVDTNNPSEVIIETSDLGSVKHSCSPGESKTCTVTDQQSSIPKNMANMVCSPGLAGKNLVITSGCQTLLDQGAGSCELNNLHNVCNTASIAPTCLWTTSSDASTPATWTWNITTLSDGYQLDCSNSGYQGVTPLNN